MDSITGFLTKFFSLDSIASRLARTVSGLTAFIAATSGSPHGWQWYTALIGLVVTTMTPAGQNQSSPTTLAAKKSVPRTA